MCFFEYICYRVDLGSHVNIIHYLKVQSKFKKQFPKIDFQMK